MTTRIRVGIVGAGFFGSMMATACAAHGSFQVTEVTDVSRAAAERLAAEHGADVAEGYLDLAASDRVDLVIVATPNHLHADAAVAALRAGKHVFVEKPIGIDRDSVERIIRASQGAGGILVVGHVMRCFPGVRRMVADARSGALGRVLEVAGARRRVVHLPADPGDWWKLDRRRTGGELLHEIHELDLVVWALGEPAEVTTTAGAPLVHGGTSVETDDVTIMRTTDGSLGRHSVSTSAHRAEWWFRIAGSEAALEADFRTGEVRRFVDGRVVETSGIFDDEDSNDSLRASAEQAQAYNAPGSVGPLWMRTAVNCELDEVAGAVRGTSTTLVEAPGAAALVVLAARERAEGAALSEPGVVA